MNGVYLVTDRAIAGGAAGLVKSVTLALEAGVRLVQLREKDLNGGELLALAKRLRSVTQRHGAKLFVNDRLDVALLAGADGVHLAQSGFSPLDAWAMLERVQRRRFLIGVSTHSVEEARAAVGAGADYITVGPVYDTPSKAAYGAPVGAAIIGEIRAFTSVPLFAIGGVGKGRVKEVLDAGADGFAVIRAILGSKDVKRSAGELIRELYECRDPA